MCHVDIDHLKVKTMMQWTQIGKPFNLSSMMFFPICLNPGFPGLSRQSHSASVIHDEEEEDGKDNEGKNCAIHTIRTRHVM